MCYGRGLLPSKLSIATGCQILSMQSLLNRLLPLAVMLFVAIYFFLKVMASPHSESSDTLSLFNPVYMQHFYGQMAYPAYNQFESMVIHPPLHYQLIALFYGVGFNAQASMMMPFFLSVLLVLCLIGAGSFSFEWKISYAMALVVVSSFTFASLGIRPDYILSVCWFGGLVCMENARITNWKTVWLFMGAFLLSVTSILHYFGAFAFLGAAPYMVHIYRTRERNFFTRKAIWVAAPVLLIVAGYFLFHIIPNARDVARQIAGTIQIHQQGSIEKHYEVYRDFFNGYFFQKLLIVPVCVVAFLFLAIKPETRLLAFAGLPVTFFVLLFSSGKSGGYFIPEFLMLTFSVFLLLYWCINRLYVTFFKHHVLFLNATVAAIACMYASERIADVRVNIQQHFPSVGKAFTRNSELVTMRSCSQYALGKNAKMASRMDLWYVSGAKDWFNIMPDMIQQDKYATDSLQTFLASFDAVAEHAHMSNNTLRSDKHTINTLYLNHILHLRMFYLTNNFSSPANANVLPMLFYTTDTVSNFEGFYCSNNTYLTYYKRDTVNSDFVFFASVLAAGSVAEVMEDSIGICNVMTLPDDHGGLYQLAKDVHEVLLWGIIPRSRWSDGLAKLNLYGKVIQTIPLRSFPLQLNDILNGHEEQVNFYNTYAAYLESKPYYQH